MDLMSKKIDYRSQAEKDYQAAVFNYKQMFRSSPEHLKAITNLEKLCENSENRIRTAKIKAKPPGRKKRVVKQVSKRLSVEEQERLSIKKALLRQEEKRQASAMKERIRLQVEAEDKRVLPTREIDHRVLVPVKIDAKTTIYIKPGRDPIEAKRNFLEKRAVVDPEPKLPTSTPGCKTDYQVWMERVKELARKQDVAISKYHLDFFQARFRESTTAVKALKMYVDQTTL